jgi:uncharacterized protein YggE
MTGEGPVSITPDQAVATGTVATHARRAGDALAENREIVTRVTAALKQNGIADRDVKVVNFHLYPQHPPYDPKTGQSSKIIGYEVSNVVMVTIGDIAKAGAALDTLIESGAIDNTDVSFGFKDEHAIRTQARAAAAKDARERADIYARELGTELGAVISVREGSRPVSLQDVGGDAVESVVVTGSRVPEAGLYSSSPVTAVSPTDQTINAQVTVVWALK